LRALLGVLAYTFARIGAVVNLKVEDYYPSGKRFLLRFKEKGGKEKELPVHHKLEELLDEYLKATGLENEPESPLFPAAERNGDPTTNEWASKVIAKERRTNIRISTSGSIYSAGGSNSQSSVTEVEEDSCPPKEFIGLKNGGRKNNYSASAGDFDFSPSLHL
jgi:hypothetical protein